MNAGFGMAKDGAMHLTTKIRVGLLQIVENNNLHQMCLAQIKSHKM